MTREWKPGDVAIVDGPGERLPITFFKNEDHDGLMFNNGSGYQHSARHLASSARPLVVIDPEDREQAERLADALVAVMCTQDPDWDKARAYEVRSHMRSALREFANPTREVFEHLPVTVNDNGSLVAHCGKVWMPGAPGVVAVGKCPECMGFAESGWTA